MPGRGTADDDAPGKGTEAPAPGSGTAPADERGAPGAFIVDEPGSGTAPELAPGNGTAPVTAVDDVVRGTPPALGDGTTNWC
jgi:hypothetical protein